MSDESPSETRAFEQRDAQHLRDFLADRDTPCPACGYNIRQLQTSSCPECGRTLKLTVGVESLSNTWIMAMVAAIVPAACGLPFQILILIALAYGESFSGITQEPAAVVFLLLVFYTLCCWVFSILLLVMRQRFMRLKAQAQNGISTALIIADLIGALVVFGLIGSL